MSQEEGWIGGSSSLELPIDSMRGETPAGVKEWIPVARPQGKTACRQGSFNQCQYRAIGAWGFCWADGYQLMNPGRTLDVTLLDFWSQSQKSR